MAVCFPGSASAQAVLVDGLGGPVGYGSDVLAANDDASSSAISLTTAFPNGLNYYGVTQSSLYVNNNGNVSLGNANLPFSPNPFPTTNVPMIAPYYGDVDTRGTAPANESRVYWNLATGRLVVTWFRVGYYSMHVDKTDSFQLILQDASATGSPGDFDVEFRYNRCQWTTGDASGGTGGLGGTPAQAGFDAGTHTAFRTLPGSLTAAILDLCTTSNVNDPGVWRYRVRDAVIVECGDGVIAGGEACDDDGVADGDGCSADCSVEDGWDCDGEPSVCADVAPECGDGALDAGEECDDGDGEADDGCDSCVVEDGWTCTGQPSACTGAPIVCGDGSIADAEECDDGNSEGGDGCDGLCSEEADWQCEGEPSTCSPIDPGGDDAPADDGGGGCCSAGRDPHGAAILLLALVLAWRRRRPIPR